MTVKRGGNGVGGGWKWVGGWGVAGGLSRACYPDMRMSGWLRRGEEKLPTGE